MGGAENGKGIKMVTSMFQPYQRLLIEVDRINRKVRLISESYTNERSYEVEQIKEFNVTETESLHFRAIRAMSDFYNI